MSTGVVPPKTGMSLWKKITIGVVAFLVVMAIIGSFMPDEKPIAQPQQTVTVTATPTPSPTPTPTPEVTPTPTPNEEPSVDDVYLALFRDRFPQYNAAKDNTVISAGKETCTFFKNNGVTQGTVVQYGATIMDTLKVDASDAGYFLGLATKSYCPGVFNQMQDVLGSVDSTT